MKRKRKYREKKKKEKKKEEEDNKYRRNKRKKVVRRRRRKKKEEKKERGKTTNTQQQKQKSPLFLFNIYTASSFLKRRISSFLLFFSVVWRQIYSESYYLGFLYIIYKESSFYYNMNKYIHSIII